MEMTNIQTKISEIIKSSDLLEKTCSEKFDIKISEDEFKSVLKDLTDTELEIIFIELVGNKNKLVFHQFNQFLREATNNYEIINNQYNLISKTNNIIKKDIEFFTLEEIEFINDKISKYKKFGYDFFEFIIKYSHVHTENYIKLKNIFDYLKEQFGV